MFDDREEAGKLLGEELKNFIKDKENAVILAIPRGGVPVAYWVSKKTGIPFGMVVAKKVAFPEDPEAAIGAAAPDGTFVLSDYISESSPRVSTAIEKAVQEAREKLNKYLSGKEPDVEDKTVIIIDDGIATGYTAIVAGMYAKKKGARKVILAVPVCPSDSINKVKKIFDEVICYHKVDSIFFAVGAYYRDFHQVSDEELLYYLNKAKEEGLLYL
ncbi:Predicted phosphoribosyltransferase [Persephonella hydrogeniphila]|uniref:Predicted phosphoribosyltransferase n=1 Tax=Persephonella hydrogeniphila TaxID=198703 RepID=A0A285NQC2_9AQUI|nr:phosphoribosyltransferase family protein [Persephonella hydrogeniphila]SNZ11714.1 Predicted phosphoribosyltransferase [Persephonella hydrogeniphila]